jgi:hypothetical protein
MYTEKSSFLANSCLRTTVLLDKAYFSERKKNVNEECG